MFQHKPTINRDYLLEKIGEEAIFHKYLGFWPELNTRFKNTLRGDKDPDCFFYTKEGRLYFKDFAGGYHWDCFNAAQFAYQCSFAEVLQKIAKDFGLIEGEKEIIVTRNTIDKNKGKDYEYPLIEIKIKKIWSKGEKQFWKDHYVTGDRMQKYFVFALQSAWVNKRQVFEYRSDKDIGFAYGIRNGNVKGLKLYFPLRSRQEGRFFHDLPFLIQGYHQLPQTADILFITKSNKDVICFDMFNLPAIAPMAESISILPKQMLELKQRFNYIYSLMDFDRTGRRLAKQLKEEFDIPYLFFTNGEFGLYNFKKIKDFAQHLKERGPLETLDVIQYFQKYIYPIY